MNLESNSLHKPLFLIGAPRSGTTLIFEVLSSHPAFGWLTSWHNRFPQLTSLSAAARLCVLSPSFRKRVRRSDQRKTPLDYLRQGPSEAYGIWGRHLGESFASDFLLETRATSAQKAALVKEFARVLAFQGKKRLAIKITGPSRMAFLQDIFDDARFVHIIRDGRAVVNSLMKVDFWADTFRRDSPTWAGGMPSSYIQKWQGLGESPLALASLQWRNIIEVARQEHQNLPNVPYLEIRYEDFMENPKSAIAEILEFADLEGDTDIERFISTRVKFKNMNLQFMENFSRDDLDMLENLLGDLLLELGYSSSAAR